MTPRTLIAPLLITVLTACQPADDRNTPPTVEETGEVDVTRAEADPDAARAVVADFHRALVEADSARVIELLHPDAIIYEAGHAETVDEYRAGHLAADIRFAAASERHVLSEQTVVLGDAVVYLSESHVAGAIGEREIDSRGVETMVLVPEGDGWRIRHIHWSNR
jgi:ketosteroid isomerase-like protein